MKKSNIILIGCGPHAKRIYLPALQKLSTSHDVQLHLVVDIKSTEQSIHDAIQKNSLKPEVWFVEPFTECIPENFEKELDDFVIKHRINGVIIATEPLVHKFYAKWALKNHLNILMDKPLTARRNSTTCMNSALGILHDYEELLTQYQKSLKKEESVFIINSQRRFHDGFIFVENMIKEVAEKTNCPVTHIQSSHCDGQWRFPSEIVTQEYHPYCYGYGKASHSGYHIFDIAYRLYRAACTDSKLADSMEIISSMVKPNGFIKQLTEQDYIKILGEKYLNHKQWSDTQLETLYENFGEIDVSALVSLKKDAETIANFSINLMHNGFSRRTWLKPGSDLYKGNGRVKHENHNIQQGPFQNIQIHSYQSNDDHSSSQDWSDDLGGNNHFDVYIFRNPLISNYKQSMQIYKFSDIFDTSSNANVLAMESIKFKVVIEFIEYIAGIKKKDSLQSQIEDHCVPVQLISGVYRSNILRENHQNGVVHSPFGLR